MKECIKEAKNVDEAIELACQELGVSRDIVDFEIISLPKSTFFGLKRIPAKVRVYFEEPEQAVPPAVRELRPRKQDKPRQQSASSEQKKEDQPKNASEQKQKQDKAPRHKEEKASTAKKPRETATQEPELVFVDGKLTEGKAKAAFDYVSEILETIGVEAEVLVAQTDSAIVLRLQGDSLGVVIGRRGETLDSLQYLAGLVANRSEGDYVRVMIDSGNYREKRERTLQQLAKKLSATAIRYGRPTTLEPMNPYERRIIHATVSTIDGVSSSSVGEEPNRRVVIQPDNPKPRANRGGKGRSGSSRGGRSGGKAEGRSDRKPGDRGGKRQENRVSAKSDDASGRRNVAEGSNRITPTEVDREYAREIVREIASDTSSEPKKAAPAVHEEPAKGRTQILQEGADLPLYGKIEL